MAKNKSVEILDLYEELYKLVNAVKASSDIVSKKQDDLSNDINKAKADIEDSANVSVENIRKFAKNEQNRINKSVKSLEDAVAKAESMLNKFEQAFGAANQLEDMLTDLEERLTELEDAEPQGTRPRDFQRIGTIADIDELNREILNDKVPVHRVNWTNNYWFLVESIEGSTAHGKTYNNGTWSSPYERSATQDNYQLYERGLNISAVE